MRSSRVSFFHEPPSPSPSPDLVDAPGNPSHLHGRTPPVVALPCLRHSLAHQVVRKASSIVQSLAFSLQRAKWHRLNDKLPARCRSCNHISTTRPSRRFNATNATPHRAADQADDQGRALPTVPKAGLEDGHGATPTCTAPPTVLPGRAPRTHLPRPPSLSHDPTLRPAVPPCPAPATRPATRPAITTCPRPAPTRAMHRQRRQ